jgi:hypothetical protein
MVSLTFENCTNYIYIKKRYVRYLEDFKACAVKPFIIFLILWIPSGVCQFHVGKVITKTGKVYINLRGHNKSSLNLPTSFITHLFCVDRCVKYRPDIVTKERS